MFSGPTPTQFFWTFLVGIVGLLIPLCVQWVALAQTKKHPFACTRCNRDVPVGSERCPNCGAAALNSDQPN